MTYYVPGLGEKDPDKVIRSLMQAHEVSATNADDIASNTADIATNTADIATNTADIATNTANIATNTSSISTINTTLSTLGGSKRTNSLSADVVLNNTSNYFTGPSIAQGSTGTWVVFGTVTLLDSAGAASFTCKLWDGTTVLASAQSTSAATNFRTTVSLFGIISSPAGNLRISCKDTSSTSGLILFNQTGESKDSTITAFRIA